MKTELAMNSRDRVVFLREGLRELEAVATSIAGGPDIVVNELEMRSERSEMVRAPLDHFPVHVDPNIAAYRRVLLLEKLSGQPAAPAAEIENRVVGVGGKIRVEGLPHWVVEVHQVKEGPPSSEARMAAWGSIDLLSSAHLLQPGFAIWTHLLQRFTLASERRDTLTAMLPAGRK